MTLILQPTRREALLGLAAAAFMPQAFAATPGNSVYNLDVKLTDQDGRPLELDSLRGSPVLASMFYSSCQMVCPMIFEAVHATLRAMPAPERKAARILMVTFDPERDTTEVLKKTAGNRNCDSQWTLARTDANSARKVAAAFGIQYRRLSDGEYNHSTTILALDREGRIAAKSGKLNGADPVLVKAMHQAFASAS